MGISKLRRQIDMALTRLSPFEQTVFTQRHLQNFKLKEIAVVVDRSGVPSRTSCFAPFTKCVNT